MKVLLKYFGMYGALFALLAFCTCSRNVAGAGSETTNGIAGCVVNGDGTPALNATVRLFPADYNPGSGVELDNRFTTTTDAGGRFEIKRIDPGTYSVIAKNEDRSSNARVIGIVVESMDSSVAIDSCRLAAPGTVVIDFSGTANSASGYCYLPGTDIYAPVDSNRRAQLSFVPSGIFASVVHVQSATLPGEVVRYDVTVLPEERVNIDNPGWKHTRSIYFNTTLSGANIGRDLLDVPVLLRLDNGSFNFSEAQQSGADLLFSTVNNRPVPFEIERWDAAARVAEIWLHIDTLLGNSSEQHIAMYWGASATSATTKSSVSTVFDTAAKFQGVWHLGDATNDSAHDATANRYHGFSPDSARPAIVPGIVGNGRGFNGTSSYITMPNSAKSRISFPQNGQYTISTWVYIENPDNHSHVIVSKGNAQYFLWHTTIHLEATLWEFADYRNESGWDLATAPVSSGEWVFIAGVRDGTSHVLYVNGERVDTLIDYPFSVTRSDQSDLMIGRFAQIMASPNGDEGYCFFKGSIDEVQISSVARSAEWMRLAYKNQCKNDKLIVFK